MPWKYCQIAKIFRNNMQYFPNISKTRKYTNNIFLNELYQKLIFYF